MHSSEAMLQEDCSSVTSLDLGFASTLILITAVRAYFSAHAPLGPFITTPCESRLSQLHHSITRRWIRRLVRPRRRRTLSEADIVRGGYTRIHALETTTIADVCNQVHLFCFNFDVLLSQFICLGSFVIVHLSQSFLHLFLPSLY